MRSIDRHNSTFARYTPILAILSAAACGPNSPDTPMDPPSAGSAPAPSVGSSDPSVAYPDSPIAVGTSEVPAVGGTEIVRSALGGTTTPAATGSWDSSPSSTQDLSTDSGFWADQQISTSSTHVIVTQRASLGFFTRQGQQLTHESSDSFFSPVNPAGGTFDTRTVWDQFRGRFVVTALSNTANANKFLIAVSQGSDPRNGWCMYTSTAGAGLTSDTGADYDLIAVGTNAYVATYNVNGKSLLRIYPAQQMANCVNGANLTGLWNFISPDLLNGNGGTPGVIAPAMIHSNPSDNRIYAVSTYGTSNATVWRVTNPLLSTRALSHVNVAIPGEAFQEVGGHGSNMGAPQSGTTFKYGMYIVDGITGSFNPALKAVLSSTNELGFVFNDAHDWGGGSTASIHIVSVNPDTGSVIKNRKWGAAALWYAWPNIEVNTAGDWAISFMRTGTSQFPEARYSAWGNTDTDIRGSASLHSASLAFSSPGSCGAFCSFGSAYNGNETSSSSLDPDGVGIWFSTMLPENPRAESFTQWVNKAYGNSLCTHEICQSGPALIGTCQSCVQSICTADPFCCTVADNWDGICVSEVSSICGISCP